MDFDNSEEQYIRGLLEGRINGHKRNVAEELRNAARRKMSRCGNHDEDVMSKYYCISTNRCKPIRLGEGRTLDLILNLHGVNGYVSISALRSEKDGETNEGNTKSLLQQIRRSGFSFFPIYVSGFPSPESSECRVYEPSFIVFNYDRHGNVQNFKSLYKLALNWCSCFGQQSVLIKAPNEVPSYVNSNGQEARKETIWSDGMVYINPIPQNLNEMRRRGNEIYIWSAPPTAKDSGKRVLES